MPFCSECGKPTVPNNKFCPNCGINLYPEQSPESMTFQKRRNGGERILGVQSLQLPRFGGGGSDEMMFVTTDRLIIARIRNTKKQWHLFFGMAGSLHDSLVTEKKRKAKDEKLSKKMVNQNPEDILKADKNNYAISNVDIQKIEIRKGLFQIKTIKKKHKWIIIPTERGWTKTSYKQDVRKLEIILRPILGEKLSVKI